MLNKTSLLGIIAATIAFIAVPAFAAETFLGEGDFVGITFWIVSIGMWASTIFFFYEGMRVSSKWRTSMVVAGLITFIAVPAFAADTFLGGEDFVGITFWIVSIAMWASTIFFFYEGMRVSAKWRTSMVVAGLITFIAAVHYMYMRDFWVATGESPTVYRYIDWVLTVPLQMVEFFLILVAAGAAVSGGAFWRLLVGTLVMIVGGYLGEAGYISVLLGFIIGMIGWAVIIWEIFRGEASQAATTKESVTSAFNAMRLIVLVGWAIYPLGYVFGLMMGSVDADTLNWIYNLADFINKILFGLVIWAAATKDSAAEA
jgi:bacteriorhodopsin